MRPVAPPLMTLGTRPLVADERARTVPAPEETLARFAGVTGVMIAFSFCA